MPSTMKTVNPHFFKVIMNDNILHGKLAIPKKFQRVYGDNLSEEVLLRVPSGDQWKIQLVKQDEDLWLQGGWVEFAEFYSLAHGYLIVFKFEGDGNFQILIFDQTASEIDYPCLTNHDQGHGSNINSKSDVEQLTTALEIDYPCLTNHDQGQDSDINSESDVEQLTSAEFFAKNSDKTKQVKRLRETSPSESRRSNKRLKTDAASRKGETQSQADNGLIAVPEESGRDATRKKKQSILNDDEKTFEKTASENRSFSVTLQLFNLRRRSTLGVPLEFARMYLTKGDGDAILSNSHNKTWHVKYSCETCRENPTAKFYDGWSTFAKDNSLKVGDVCVFKLMQQTEVSFSVTFSRKANDTNSQRGTNNAVVATSIKPKQVKVEQDSAVDHKPCSSSQKAQKDCSNPQRKTRIGEDKISTIRGSERSSIHSLTPEEKSRALQRASCFKSKNPFFTVAIQPTYLYRVVNIPRVFALNHFVTNREVTLRITDGTCWSVGLYAKNGKALFTDNWAKFAQDNNLKRGDACVFELMQGVKNSLNVYIF